MDVRPIMPLAPAVSVGQGAPARVAERVPAATVDTAAILPLSPSDTDKLIRILEPPALPQQPSTLQDLLQGAASAAQRGDLGSALNQLAEFIKLDPNRADTLRGEPGLEQIRTQVDQLLMRLESIAGLDAQGALREAAKVLESWGQQPLPGWDMEPQALLTAANRLYDAGGYVNYLHAASLAQVVVEGADVPIALPPASIAALIDLALLRQFSPSDTDKVIRILEPPALPQQLSTLRDLLRLAVSAAQRGDVPGALKQLEDLVKLDPSRANTLRGEPGLERIRTQVDQLLMRLESMAGLDAQALLREAAKALETWGRRPLPGWDMEPQALLTAANRLYDAGGYVNQLYAASLAQVVIQGIRFPIAAIRTGTADPALKSAPASKFIHWLKALWVRAPLLIVLVSWFMLGLAAIGVAAMLHYFWPGQFPLSIIDSGFAMWGIGLLALIAFGFYMRVRHVRFR